MPVHLHPTSRVGAVLAAAAALLVAASTSAAPPLATVLDQAPAETEMVLVVPSLSGLSEKIAAFSAGTGLDAYAPELGDALGSFKRQLGVVQGVDDDGAFLLMVTGIAEAMNSELNDDPEDDVEPKALALVPVSDYGAFVQELGGDAAADATAVTFGEDEGFARKVGGYALLGDSMEAVQAYAPGHAGQAMTEGLGELVSRYTREGDSVICLNMKALAEPMNAAVDQGMSEIRREMGDDATMRETFGPMIDSFVNLYEEGARQLIEGTDMIVLSLDLGERGLGLTMATQLVEGSQLARTLSPAEDGVAADSSSLLAAMPEQPYIYAAAIDGRAFQFESVIQQISDALGKAEAEGGIAEILKMYRTSFELAKQTDGVASVFYAPEPAALMGGGFYNTLTVYDVKDPAAFVAEHQAMFTDLGDTKLTLPAAEEGAEPMEISFNTQYTPKAMVIEGVDVDQYQMNMILPPQMVQEMGPMAMMLGNAGYNGYIARTDKQVLMTTVTDPQLITQGIRAVKSGDGIGSAGAIAQMRAEALPPSPSMEAYLSLGGIWQTVSPFMAMAMQNPPQIVVPADLPPLAMGGSAMDDGVALRFYVPADLVRFGVDAFSQTAAQQQPAGGSPRAPRAN